MAIQVSPQELAKKAFVLTYDVVRDVYSRPNDTNSGTVNGWASLVQEKVECQRKVEQDHKMSYLCRNVGKTEGRISWRINHPGQSIRALEVRLSGITSFADNASVKATLTCGSRRETFPKDGKLQLTGIGKADFTEIAVEFTGGSGTYNDWQHSQLFRTPTGSPNTDNLFVSIQFEDADARNVVVQNPAIPTKLEFSKHAFGQGFVPPRRIRIVGTPLDKGDKWFSVNLVEPGEFTKDANAPFHFNPRQAEGHVIRNNFIKGKGWQAEEREGGYPFALDKQFVLDLIAETKNKVKCIVDGQPFCEFGREDMSKVAKLEIYGEVQIQSVTFFVQPPAAVSLSNLKLPATVKFGEHGLPKGFTPPQSIRIVAVPLDQGKRRIDINLGSEGELYRDGNVLLHFNPRFTEKAVVRNNWRKGQGWVGPEERDGEFPFTMGKQFTLDLVASEPGMIKCVVDGKSFCECKARDDLGQVSQLNISEAVDIKSVTIS